MEFDPQGSSSDLGNPTLNSIRNALVILKKSFSSRLPVCLAVNFSIYQWHTEELQRRFSPLCISAVHLARGEDKDIFEEKQTSTWLTVVLYHGIHGRRRRPSFPQILPHNAQQCYWEISRAGSAVAVTISKKQHSVQQSQTVVLNAEKTNTMNSGYNVIKG